MSNPDHGCVERRIQIRFRNSNSCANLSIKEVFHISDVCNFIKSGLDRRMLPVPDKLNPDPKLDGIPEKESWSDTAMRPPPSPIFFLR